MPSVQPTSAKASAGKNKSEVAKTLREKFDRAVSSVVLDFRGLDAQLDNELRVQLREAGVEYRVVKNNLVRQALKGTPLENNDALDTGLIGQSAIAWSFEDPSSGAKVVKEFLKREGIENKLRVKCGVLGEQVLNAKQVENQLATLPSKKELQAQLLATLQAPAQNLVRQLNAAGQNFAYLLSAQERKLGGS